MAASFQQLPCAAALILGLVAVIRKHSSVGIAWSGCIIAAVILTASTISFVQGDDHWDNEFKDKYMPDYGDIIPEVSEYAAGLPEEVSLF